MRNTPWAPLPAAADWNQPPQRKHLQGGLAGSWEDLFHQTGVERFLLALPVDPELSSLAEARRLQRAIGVIYRPESERQSHYLYTRLTKQFDAMIHIDETTAVEPLNNGVVWSTHGALETFPSGM